MTWIDEVTHALEELGGEAHLDEIVYYIENDSGRDLSNNHNIKYTVQGTLQSACSEAKQWKGKLDLFYSVEGFGSGKWGLKAKVSKVPRIKDFDEIEDITDLPERINIEIHRVIRDTELTKKIKNVYEHKCLVCNKRIKLADNTYYSEAHHIKPLGEHKGPDSLDNIIVLCPNHHVEFDYGIIAIDPKTKRIVHRNKKNKFIGNVVKLMHNLNEIFLDYHFQNIFKCDEIDYYYIDEK